MNKAKLGQNFLVNKNVASKIVKTFLPANGLILEIGPGRGILTELLIQQNLHGRLIAVEKDPVLYRELKRKFSHQITLYNEDILTIELKKISNNQSVNIISNAPYYISREILDWLIQQNDLILKGTFMMQKEVVDKLIKNQINSKDARNILFNLLYSPVKEFVVSPGSFSPPPRVQSIVFSFKNKLEAKIDHNKFYNFLKICFFNRRKTLTNNLVKQFPPALINQLMLKYQIDKNQRAENTEIDIFLDLFSDLTRVNLF